MSTDDLPGLGRAVKVRRLDLGLARLKAATMAGISKDTWKRVEEGLPVRDLAYPKIERTLEWAPGSCAAIRGGGAPVPATQSAADPSVTIADVTDNPRGKAVRRIVESASIGVTNLPAGEIRELSERIVDDLVREGII